MDLQAVLHDLFLKGPANCFDAFIGECQKWYLAPARTLVELRTRENKKIRGDIFEMFCVLYLKEVRGYEAWRLEDVPEDILEATRMKRKDMGIDLIVRKDGQFSAVQCKYKTPTGRKTSITWKALSTFYALCMRTGPWDKYIVMTNCDYTRRVGEKTEKDISICLKTFQGISAEDWIRMCGAKGQLLAAAETPKTVEELRAARLRFFDAPLDNMASPDSNGPHDNRGSPQAQDSRHVYL
jgi:Restriction endonuclease